MALIQNQAVLQKLIDELRLSPAIDKIPTELADKVLATFQINTEEVTVQTPTANIVKGSVLTSGATNTIYTVPSTGKFFLTNIVISGSVSGAGKVGSFDAKLTVDGVEETILKSYLKTGTSNEGDCITLILNLQNPILIDAGTNITITSSIADIASVGSIVGYTSD